MKIKVSIQVEKQEGFVITREIEVELSEETVNEVAKQIYAAQQRVHLTGGILPPSEPLSPPQPGTGIEYLSHQPTSK